MGLAHTWRVKGKPFQRMQLLRFMGGAEEGLMSFPNKYPPKRRGQMLSSVLLPLVASPDAASFKGNGGEAARRRERFPLPHSQTNF